MVINNGEWWLTMVMNNGDSQWWLTMVINNGD